MSFTKKTFTDYETVIDAAFLNGIQDQVITNENNINSVMNAMGSTASGIVDTASGAIASFPDGSGAPFRSIEVEFSPVQDLHGQEAPWPPGGGKNKLPNLQPSDSGTLGGVAWVKNADGSMTLNNTATATQSLNVAPIDSGFIDMLPDGDYILSGCPEGGSSSTYRLIVNINNNQTFITDTGNGASFTKDDTVTSLSCYIRFNSGTVFNNLTFYPMIRLSSVSDATFAPYSNICPISGHTGCEIYDNGVNQWDEVWELGIYSATDGSPIVNNNRIRSKNPIPVKPNTSYYFYCGNSDIGINVHYFNASGEQITTANPKNAVFTTPSNTAYIKFNTATADLSTYNQDISINYPSADHDYHEFSGMSSSIQFGQTSFGGKLVSNIDGSLSAVDGVAIVHAKDLTWYLQSSVLSNPNGTVFEATADVPFKGWASSTLAISNILAASDTGSQSNSKANSFWWNNASTGYRCIWGEPYGQSTLSEFTAFLEDNDVIFCGELASPVTIPVSASYINTLVGKNVVFSNCGNIKVSYLADTKAYIDKKIAEYLGA